MKCPGGGDSGVQSQKLVEVYFEQLLLFTSSRQA